MQLKRKSVMSWKDRGELDKREEKSRQVLGFPFCLKSCVLHNVILWFFNGTLMKRRRFKEKLNSTYEVIDSKQETF